MKANRVGVVLSKYLPVIFDIKEVNAYIYIHPFTYSKDINPKFKKKIAVAINEMKHM